jgi:hypothetical protein
MWSSWKHWRNTVNVSCCGIYLRIYESFSDVILGSFSLSSTLSSVNGLDMILHLFRFSTLICKEFLQWSWFSVQYTLPGIYFPLDISSLHCLSSVLFRWAVPHWFLASTSPLSGDACTSSASLWLRLRLVSFSQTHHSSSHFTSISPSCIFFSIAQFKVMGWLTALTWPGIAWFAKYTMEMEEVCPFYRNITTCMARNVFMWFSYCFSHFPI